MLFSLHSKLAGCAAGNATSMGSAGAQARGNGWYYPGEQGGDSGVRVHVTSLFFFFLFLTVSINLKVSVREIDLTKENSVSALVLE